MSKLFTHSPHPHQPRNVNALHQAERLSVNDRIAAWVTRHVNTMPTAYLFTMLALVGLLGLLNLLNPITFLLATWLSQQFLQLVFLPVLGIGQQVLSRHSELMAEEQFSTTQKSYHHLEEIMRHLDAQDEKIFEMLAQNAEILKRLDPLAHNLQGRAQR